MLKAFALLLLLLAVSVLLRRLGQALRAPPGGSAAGAPAGPMTRRQALEILGLGDQPTRQEIIAAHRRLMQKVHPDRGGSKYLAQQLNEAKARLLKDL